MKGIWSKCSMIECISWGALVCCHDNLAALFPCGGVSGPLEPPTWTSWSLLLWTQIQFISCTSLHEWLQKKIPDATRGCCFSCWFIWLSCIFKTNALTIIQTLCPTLANKYFRQNICYPLLMSSFLGGFLMKVKCSKELAGWSLPLADTASSGCLPTVMISCCRFPLWEMCQILIVPVTQRVRSFWRHTVTLLHCHRWSVRATHSLGHPCKCSILLSLSLMKSHKPSPSPSLHLRPLTICHPFSILGQ